MNILITTDRISPVLGFVLEELEALQIEPTVHFQRENRFLGPDLSAPAWAPGVNPLVRERFFKLESDATPSLVLALGFSAASHALERFRGCKLLTVLLPGDLDFSSRNRQSKATFQNICAGSHALVLMNEWEMTKALIHGSSVPQFLWNPAQNNLDLAPFSSTVGDIAVVYDAKSHDVSDIEEDPSIKALQETAGILGQSIRFMESNAFFWYKDFMASRLFSDVVSLRLRGISHLYFWDDDADSTCVYAAIADSPHQIAVRPTISASLTARSLPNVVVGSPVTWAYDFVSPGNVARPDKSGAATTRLGRPLWEILDQVLEETLFPWYWEDYGDFRSFHLFPSVAAVENRSDGARPQRIRNMYLALSNRALTLQLNFDEHLLMRRELFIRELVEQGVRCEFVYGENSTNPVRAKDSIIRMYRLIDHLSARQATPSSWFVRDLHWLDDDILSGDVGQEARQFGKFELERLSQSFGVLLSPSVETSRLFNNLVCDEIDVHFTDAELPPGVNLGNCVRIEGEDPGVTFLYSGGIGSAYKMTTYLDAVAELLDTGSECGETPLRFDFLVRPAEQETLIEALRERGVFAHPAIRILNGNFDTYEPLTKEIVGVLLLESRYASSAFPYKSVSYVEKGMRFLAFKGAPAARIFGPAGVVIQCERDTARVAETLQSLAQHTNTEVDWNTVWRQHSWDERVSAAMETARVADREDP